MKFGDGLAELFAFLGVAHRALVGALRHAQSERRDGDAAAIEDLQAIDEAFAFRAQEILRGHAAIGEDHFAGVARAQAELVFFLAGTKARSTLLDDECGDTVVLLGGVGDGHGHAHVGIVSIGGEGFCAIDYPTTVFLGGHGARAARIRSRFRLGERPAAQLFSLRQRDYVFLFLLFGAEFVDVIGAQRIVRGDDDADGTIHARKLLDDDGVFDDSPCPRRHIFRGK